MLHGEKIGVLGTGTMGKGIAQLFLQHGFKVVMVGTKQSSVTEAKGQILEGLKKAEKKGFLFKVKNHHEAFINLEGYSDVKKLTDCFLVVEAIPEVLKEKQKAFLQLEKTCRNGAILASNTSSIPIHRIAKNLKPETKKRVVGMHFFNPAPAMKLVEVVQSRETSEETVNKTVLLAERVQKAAVVVHDLAGFVSNRLLMVMINEAVQELESGVSDAAHIDTVMKLGMNHPMGPLELADFIGLDVCHDIMQSLHENFKVKKYKPAKLLRDMVRKGKLGRKTGEGFYKYK